MSEFKNIRIIKKANIYFEGKVTSRTIYFPDGSRKTLGIMLPGTYQFGTEKKEVIEILSGDLDVLLPGHTEWQSFKMGGAFEVPADASFDLKVKTITDYCCSYI